MSYYDTIAEDLTRAKAILAEGKPSSDGLPKGIEATGGTIFGKDIYAAYKLLESFVEEIERLQRELAFKADSNREQLRDLMAIRKLADKATGTDRSKGDPREPGALGAVQLLVERFERRRVLLVEASGLLKLLDRDGERQAVTDWLDAVTLQVKEGK